MPYKLNLVYDKWDTYGHLPNCLDRNVLQYALFDYPKLRKEGLQNNTKERWTDRYGFQYNDLVHRSYIGEKCLGPAFNMWTNELGFTYSVNEFNPISYIESKNIRNWIYPIEPFGHLHHSLNFDLDRKEKISFFDYIPPEIIDDVNLGKGRIMINYAHEGWVGDFLLKSYYMGVQEAKINPNNIVMLVNDTNIERKLKDFFKRHPMFSPRQMPKLINYCYYVIQSGAFFKYTPDMQIKSEDYFKNKQFKFLSLNRRLNEHRLLILSNLYNDIKNTSAISFDKTLLTNDAQEMLNSNNTLLEKYNNLPDNSFVDTTELNSTNGYKHDVSEPFKNSLISIVTETAFFKENDFISEKTWKPIWHFQPFILVGRPYTLKYLKNLGYKTFDWLFDESYDEIEDDNKRMEFIINEIKKVNSYTIEELTIKVKEHFSDLEYNHNTLLAYGESRLFWEKELIKMFNQPFNFDCYDLLNKKYISYEKII